MSGLLTPLAVQLLPHLDILCAGSFLLCCSSEGLKCLLYVGFGYFIFENKECFKIMKNKHYNM